MRKRSAGNQEREPKSAHFLQNQDFLASKCSF